MSSSDEIEFDSKSPKVDAPAGAAPGSAAIAATDTIAELSAAIASGKLDLAAVQQLLIDRVLAEHFPGADPSTDLGPMREALAKLLEGDPTLAELLRP